MNLGIAWKAVNEGHPVIFAAHGNSMTPLIKSGSTVRVEPCEGPFKVGDVVLAKVKGRLWLHKITRIADDGRYMISNNHGHENGWSSNVKGKVTHVNGEPL